MGGEGGEGVMGGTVVDEGVVGAEGLQTAEAATGTGTAGRELTHGGESCKGSGESRVNTTRQLARGQCPDTRKTVVGFLQILQVSNIVGFY